MTASTAAESSRRPVARRLGSVALLLSASFIASRILGLLRTVIIADVFGNSRSVEAYFAAFRIPDTLFMLASGGALATAFIPVFTGLLARAEGMAEGTGPRRSFKEREAWEVASTVLNSVSLALGALAAVSFLVAPQLMDFLAGGFTPAQQSLTVDLTRIMLLQPIFLGASALISAILQSYRRFVLTAIAPLVYNVAIVTGALLGRSHGVVALAWSVVIGAFAQLVIQVPGLRHELRTYFYLTASWALPESRKVVRLFVPRVVGLAAFQAMLFITLFLASRLPRGSYGAINYSWLLISFPVGALGTAAGTASFPDLVRLSVANEVEQLQWTVRRSLQLVLFLALPSACGLIVLRRPIVNLLYHHGIWTSLDTEQTAFALLFYALALAPLAAIEVLPRVFYSMEDTVTPVRIAIVAVALDAVLSIVFVNIFPRASGQGGLALATAIATTFQAIWLALALEKTVGTIGRPALLLTVRDALVASFSMSVVLYVLLDGLTALFPQRGLGALLTVGIAIAVGAGVFAGVSYLLGAPELWQMRALVRRGR